MGARQRKTSKRLIGIFIAAALVGGCGSAPEVRITPKAKFSILGNGPYVLMARLELPSGRTYDLPTSRCQEALVFVERGLIKVGDHEVPLGNAVRISGGAGRVRATGDSVLFVVFAREEKVPFQRPPTWDRAPKCRAMPPTVGLSDPASSGPFFHQDGKLKVMVYLDAPRQESVLASLGTLHGDGTVSVPEHSHEASAEALWFRNGSGTMRLGEKEIPIRANTFVYVPAGTVHGFMPDQTQGVFAYQVYAPSGPEQRFRK